MIAITDPKNCCGCEACVQACPKQCISFDADAQGFRYPKVDADACIECGRCLKSCPMLQAETCSRPLQVFAARNTSAATRLKSSSGGIFALLAQEVLSRGGVVFGARFNEAWDVIHDYTDTVEGLAPFLTSKYVQSRIGNSFKKVREFLKAGRMVLFSGTSCQVAGLRRFLQHDYELLLTADVVCHGVPSSLVWQEYLNSALAKVSAAHSNISHISFRDKSSGWKKYSLTINIDHPTSGNNTTASSLRCDRDVYMRAFLNDLSLRPSCFNCPAKGGKAKSDFTLADFWSIEKILPHMDDNQGTSMVVVNTPKAAQLLDEIPMEKIEVDYDFAVKHNPSLERCATPNPKYIKKFWDHFQHKGFHNMECVVEASIPLKLRWNLLKVSIKQALKQALKRE